MSRLGVVREVDFTIEPDADVLDRFQQHRSRVIEEHGRDVSCLLIDEAQFLTSDQVDDLLRIALMDGIPVLAYGIRTDFQTVAFPGSRRLLEVAHSLEELKTICRCGRKAIFNARRIDGRVRLRRRPGRDRRRGRGLRVAVRRLLPRGERRRAGRPPRALSGAALAGTAPKCEHGCMTVDMQRMPRRVDGVDAARGLALIGMFVAHVSPAVASLEAAELIALADDRPRLLFALTAGIGLGFISGGTRPITDGRGELRRQIAIRAVILIALGMLIWATLHPLVFIILDVYGVAFLVMLPLLFLPPRAALGLGIGSLAVTPALAELGARTEFVSAVRDTPLRFLSDWVVGGAYPVIVWVPVMLIGLALARMDLGSPRVVGVIALVGAAAASVFLPIAVAPAGARGRERGGLVGAAARVARDARQRRASVRSSSRRCSRSRRSRGPSCAAWRERCSHR